MAGDGGNDCGGLRAAHAGIALSDAEALDLLETTLGSGLGFGGLGFRVGILGLYRDNGKEDGNCCFIVGFCLAGLRV